MEKKKRYQKPEVIKIPVDIRQMVKASSGCPYVFVWDGKEYVKENSILPDSENLLRDEKVLTDYYVFKNQPSPKDGDLNFKIKEFENEISWFERFDLMTIEHPKDVSTGITSQGELLNYKMPFAPLSCKGKDGGYCLDKISNYNWESPVDYYSGKSGDYLELEFGEIKAHNLKLIIIDPKDEPFKIAQVCPPHQCEAGLKESIHVYVLNASNNKYQRIAVIHTRAEFYPDIIDLTPYLPQIKGNLKIKLEFTAPHKVAFVGIDTTPPIPMKKRVYALKEAIHSEFGDVTKKIKEENDEFVRLMLGEEIGLRFPVPEPPGPGNKLSYCLVARGYYIPTTKIFSLAKRGKLVGV